MRPNLFVILTTYATVCVSWPYLFNRRDEHNRLCARAGRPLLLAGASNGLNNQRWALLSQLATAKKFGWTFVAGQVNMELFDECKGATGFVPFSTVYSVDALQEWGAIHNVTIASDMTPELQAHCCHHMHEGWENHDEHWVAALVNTSHNPDRAVCLDWVQSYYNVPKVFGLSGGRGEDFSRLYYENKETYLSLRGALRPSRPVMRLVAHVLKQTAHLCGGNQCPFTSVHVRVEDDWASHCKHQVEMSPMRCMIRDDEIAAKLNQHGVAHGSLLHVASGMPISNLTTLCSQYKCFQSGPVLEELFANDDTSDLHLALQPLVGPSSCLTREVKAAVEFWTATHGDAFFGNFHSSFSVELAAELEHLGKPHVFMNDRCEDGQACT